MANFCELDENNIVLRVIRIANDAMIDADGNESEQLGIEECVRLIGGGRWVQTSINTHQGVHFNWDTNKPDGGKPLRGNFGNVGDTYYEDVDVFMPPKPQPWLEPLPNGRWGTTFPLNINTGEPFTHEELEYIFFYMRHTKEFRILPATPIDPDDVYNTVSCLTTDFSYPTFEESMYGFNRVQALTLASVEGGKIAIPHAHFLKKEIDLTPIVLVIHVGWEELNIDVASEALNCHPQVGARTVHELFRLIIEWAYAYTEFGNTEPAALRCHQLLCEVQMPLEVRNELLNDVPAQAVERFIRGEDPFQATSFDVITDPPAPPLFAAWYADIRKKYKPYYVGVPLPVDMASLPASYPQ